MNCSAFRKQISLLLDGALDEATAATLKAHMAGCADCQRFHDRIAAIDVTLRENRAVFPPAALTERIKSNVEAYRARKEGREFFPVWSHVAVLALVLLLAVGVGNLAGRLVTDVFTQQRADAFVDQLIPGQNGWVSDAFIELGAEERSR